MTKNEKTKQLWSQFGDIPIDKSENIEEKFLDFEIGTHREEIWHWFEAEFDISVYDLMYKKA